ncbi:putative homeodomain containing protein [Lyophyllum shimeji]|uniref:Homeodomain containing protein n=1 Tax=Lyophyllum shimeji TaxID=47721 RepID=A0A9P3PLN1_LYOSH|nr:putative homeodomain containing protein [Lyophyllum shimeji]
MLSRTVPPYSPYVSAHPTPTDYSQPLQPPPPFHSRHGLSMDPSSVDFRAFYPYTPNEVKHRKRTTTAQLKTLEAIFRRDTKPNGPLRVQLAAELGMTARGVQVWFQNRRAKEKTKAAKAAKAEKTETQDKPEPSQDAECSSTSPAETQSSPLASEPRDSSSSPANKVQVITEPSPTSWAESPIDPHSLYVDPSLHLYRRGSLPANVFPAPEHSPHSPPQSDLLDPFARRLSVDASLQRLANNPYAHLARAKNGAIYGPRAIAPTRHRVLARPPYAHPQRVASSASMPYRLDMRRASMGNFRVSPQSTASPSPSPLSPYPGVRASLPDHSLYAVTSRTVPSPIPGPLPSPNFSFGAASTPSMVSGSSDSERNSPDSVQAYAYRESEHDEDDGTPASYYALSRFGSITSIATSDSSLNSALYPEIVGCYPEDLGGRRDSCASGHFASHFASLDVNGTHEAIGSPQEHGVYTLHEDVNEAGVIRIASNDACLESNTYPSPTSTISPGPGGSPPSHSTLPCVRISRSSELNHALQSPPDQVQSSNAADQQAFNAPTVVPPAPAPVVETDITPAGEQHFYTQDVSHSQATAAAAAAVEFSNKYHYDYDPSSYLTESYPLLDGGNSVGVHPQAFETPGMGYDGMSPLDTTAHQVEQYVTFA